MLQTVLQVSFFSLAASAQLLCATPEYTDIGKASGLGTPVIYGGVGSNQYILETTGTGAAIFDFDRDGDNDVFIVNGTTFALEEAGESPTSMLYVNDGSGKFQESAVKAGIDATGWGQAACVGDIDNDGWDDLLVTYYGLNVLYRNQQGKFWNVSESLPQEQHLKRWGAGCSFLDYDGDGSLDLFISNYVDFDPALTAEPGTDGACEWKGLPVMCGPQGLPHALNILYRNRGDGSFDDVSETAGILKPGGRYALGVIAADFNQDGFVDIYVACDMTPSLLYQNNGDGTFTDIASEAGVAYNVDGQLQAGMGVAVADYDANGYLDIAKTNFSGDLPSLYQNEDGIFFEDVSFDAGLSTHQLLGWGIVFIDANEDMFPDLLIANGHVYPEVDQAPIGETYQQLTVLYQNSGNGGFKDVTSSAGPAFKVPRSARGVAVGDLDGDGHPEVVIVNLNKSPSILKRETPDSNAVLVELTGTKSNRNAIGAQVQLTVGKQKLLQTISGGGSYYSHNDFRLHFGLGAKSMINSVEVTWPNGIKQQWTDLPANRLYQLQEDGQAIESTQLKGRTAYETDTTKQ